MDRKTAYLKGWASQGTQSDWDEALERFSRKYAPGQWSVLHDAWCDGWSDRQAGHTKGHALTCPANNYGGHAECPND